MANQTSVLPTARHHRPTTLADFLKLPQPIVPKRLLHNKDQEPTQGGNVMQGEAYVQATGQLFFDSNHASPGDPGGGRGKKKMKAGTTRELHPLTDLRFAVKP